MLTPKEFLNSKGGNEAGFNMSDVRILEEYKNHILQNIIASIEAQRNPTKKSIVEFLKGKV